MAKVTRRRAPVSRRAQARQSARQTAAPPADDGAPRQTTQASLGAGLAPAGHRRNPLGFLRRFRPRFVADVISELRKVTWPSFAETRYLTVVVAIVAVAVGLLLGGLDLVFGWAIERLFF